MWLDVCGMGVGGRVNSAGVGTGAMSVLVKGVLREDVQVCARYH